MLKRASRADFPKYRGIGIHYGYPGIRRTQLKSISRSRVLCFETIRATDTPSSLSVSLSLSLSSSYPIPTSIKASRKIIPRTVVNRRSEKQVRERGKTKQSLTLQHRNKQVHSKQFPVTSFDGRIEFHRGRRRQPVQFFSLNTRGSKQHLKQHSSYSFIEGNQFNYFSL